MSSRLSAYLQPPVLSVAELSAARLDGDLFAIDDGYCSIDEPDTRELRLEILSRVVRPSAGATIAGLSAAWLHGALSTPPARHEVVIPVQARGSWHSSSVVSVRQLVIENADVTRLGRYGVTTAVRTAVDLARDHRLSSPGHVALRRLLGSGTAPPAEVIAWLDAHRRFPGRPRALRSIEAAVDATLPGLDVPMDQLAVSAILAPHSPVGGQR